MCARVDGIEELRKKEDYVAVCTIVYRTTNWQSNTRERKALGGVQERNYIMIRPLSSSIAETASHCGIETLGSRD